MSMLGTIQDITERKLAEEALRESEQQLRLSLDASSAGTWSWNAVTNEATWDNRYHESYGLGPDDPHAHSTWLSLLHLDDRSRVVEQIQQMLNSPGDDVWSMEFRAIHPKLGERWHYGRGRASRDHAGKIRLMAGIDIDITERKLAEEALRASEERYRVLMESVPQTIWQADVEGNIIDCNRYWSEYTGQTLDEAKNKGWIETVHPDDRERVNQEVREVVARGDVYQTEERLRRASDGSYRWHLGRGVPTKDDKGKVTGWIGSTTDIHDQKCAEEALKKAHDELEERVTERTAELAKANKELDIFRRFAEDAEEGFGMSDFDGRIVYANSTLCRLCGEERPEDVIGKHVSSYYPEEYKQRRTDELIPALLREGHLHIEQILLPRHGKPIQTFQSTFLIRDDNGSPFRIAVVISDITERKRAEEKVRQNRELLQAIIDNTPALIFVKDLEGRITITNRALCEAAGTDMQDVLGKTSRDFAAAAQDAEIRMANDRRVMETGQPILVEEPSFGRIFLSVKFPLKDAQGRVFAIGGVSTDITERKQAEEALRQSHDELQAMYDGMFDGLLIVDLESKRFARANASICQILGYSEAELLSHVGYGHSPSRRSSCRLGKYPGTD